MSWNLTEKNLSVERKLIAPSMLSNFFYTSLLWIAGLLIDFDVQATLLFKIICKHILYSNYHLRLEARRHWQWPGLLMLLLQHLTVVAFGYLLQVLRSLQNMRVRKHFRAARSFYRAFWSQHLLRCWQVDTHSNKLLLPTGISALQNVLSRSLSQIQQKLYTQVILPLLCFSAFVPWVLGKSVRFYIQRSCTRTISARLCRKRYVCWATPRDMVVSIL